MSHKIKITGNLNVKHEILSACLERVGRCLYIAMIVMPSFSPTAAITPRIILLVRATGATVAIILLSLTYFFIFYSQHIA